MASSRHSRSAATSLRRGRGTTMNRNPSPLATRATLALSYLLHRFARTKRLSLNSSSLRKRSIRAQIPKFRQRTRVQITELTLRANRTLGSIVQLSISLLSRLATRKRMVHVAPLARKMACSPRIVGPRPKSRKVLCRRLLLVRILLVIRVPNSRKWKILVRALKLPCRRSIIRKPRRTRETLMEKGVFRIFTIRWKASRKYGWNRKLNARNAMVPWVAPLYLVTSRLTSL